MPILPFRNSHDGSFDPETTHLMGRAFDAACALFTNLSKNDQELVADRILAEVRSGERDPVRLRNAGMAALAHLGR